MLTQKFLEFPDEGLTWVIRWIDHLLLPSGRQSSPRTKVWFSSLPGNRTISASEIYRLPVNGTPSIIHSGSLALLNPGDIFRARQRVGQIQLREYPANIDTDSIEIMQLSSFLKERPIGWNSLYPYRVVNGAEYYLRPELLDSRCAVITQGKQTLVFPSSVLFKSFYGRTPDFALAFTSKPWERNLSKLVNPSFTYIDDDGSYLVRLALSVTDDHKQSAALFALDPFAFKSANRIHAESLRSKKGHLICNIPFHETDLKLRFRAIELQSNPQKLLVIEILSYEWPYSQERMKIKYWRHQNNNNPRKKSDKETQNWSLKEANEKTSDDEGSESDSPISNTEEPGTSFNQLRTYANSTEILNAPEAEKYVTEVSNQNEGSGSKKDKEEKEKSSTGDKKPGDSDAAPTKNDLVQHNESSSQFIKLTSLFDTLVNQNVIISWRIRSPEKELHYRNSYPVFPALSKRRNDQNILVTYFWGLKSRDPKRLRSVLVAELTLHGGILVNWFDIEKRNDVEGFKSLLSVSPAYSTSSEMKDVIADVSLVNGIWEKVESVVKKIEANECATWSHFPANEKTYDYKSVERKLFKYLGYKKPKNGNKGNGE